MKFTANQIAELLEGNVVGNPEAEVSTLSKIEEGEQGSLTFLSNPKYTSYIYETDATIVVVNNDFKPEKEVKSTMIRVEDAYQAFSKLLAFYDQMKQHKVGVEQPSFISESAVLGDEVYIGAFAHVGDNVKLGNNVKIYPNVNIGNNVEIGNNTTIFSGVTVYYDSVIGENCYIHSGVIIGADGFGFAPNEDGSYTKIPQIGNVVIENDVEIGSATTIDRATMGSTIIRKGVKLDNQIQVAHNVEIGENTVIASQTGIAGSTKIGSGCQIGGQVGVVGHITIGNNVRIQAQSGIGRSLKDGEVVQGSPAFKITDYNKSYVYFKNLPKLGATVNKLEKELKELKEI